MRSLKAGLFLALSAALLLLLPLESNRREKLEVASPISQKEPSEPSPLLSAKLESTREEAKTPLLESVPVATKENSVEEKAMPGSIQGLFLDYDGNPLKKERLKIIRPSGDITGEGFGAYSDDNGYFSFSKIPPGEWWICWKPKRSETITKLQSLLVKSSEISTTTLLLEGSRTLIGRVSFNDRWTPSLDQGGIQLILSPALGPERDTIIARGWAITDLSNPEKSGSFTMSGLRPDLYRLKVIPFDEGDYLTLEIDLTQDDVQMEPVFIDPSTELIAGR
jgi:hypothetical protein